MSALGYADSFDHVAVKNHCDHKKMFRDTASSPTRKSESLSNKRTRLTKAENPHYRPKTGTARFMFHFVPIYLISSVVLYDRDRVGEHIEGRPNAPSKAQSVTVPQNHHDLFLQQGTVCDQENPHSSLSAGFRFENGNI